MTTSIDHKKEFKPFYATTKKDPHIVDVPTMNFLMLDGTGDPNTAQSYADAVTTLYNLAYAIRFAVKKTQDIAFTVMPLQGLWWMPDMSRFGSASRDEWQWTMMIMQPAIISGELVEEQIQAVRKSKQPPSIDLVRFETYSEGPAVQRLYLGVYKDEAPFIQEMHAYAAAEGYALRGKHHEIYLSDPRKVAPEKLKTILRQPVTRA